MVAHSQQNRERWHVGKEIPLALIFVLIVQTGGWIWWAATQSAKLDNLAAMMSEFKLGQYTQSDAQRDIRLGEARDREIVRRIDVIESDIRQERKP